MKSVLYLLISLLHQLLQIDIVFRLLFKFTKWMRELIEDELWLERMSHLDLELVIEIYSLSEFT